MTLFSLPFSHISHEIYKLLKHTDRTDTTISSVLTLRTLFRPLHGNFNPIRNIFRVAGQAAKGKRERRHKTAGYRRNYTKRMLRIVTTAVRAITARTNITGLANSISLKQYPLAQYTQQKYFGILSSVINRWNNGAGSESKTIIGQTPVSSIVSPPMLPVIIPARTVIKFSLTKGKRKSVKNVLKRFYRLNWGIWIRTRSGRDRHMWRKTKARRRRLKRHVFVNATQSTLLDKMVTKYWKRPHFYVDDPYNPYHKREEFLITRKQPLPLPTDKPIIRK